MGDLAWRVLLIGIVVGLLLWGLIYIRVVTIPVILAVFVTALLMPPTNWMRRNGMGRGASTAISVIGGLVLLGGIITLVVQPAISGFTGLVRSVEQGIAGLPGLLQAVGLDPDLADTAINSVQSEVQSALQEDWSAWVSQAWVAGTTVMEILIGVILVLVLTVYFVHSGDKLVDWVLTLFPGRARRPLHASCELAYGVMGRYVRGVALVGFIDAVGIGIFLIFLVDPALAVPLIVLTFIGAFLPVIGAFLTGLLAAVVALVTEGWVIALVVVAVVLVVQQLESNVFAPRVYGKALELPSAIVLVAITVGGIIGGIAGMFLATPVIAVLAALLRNRPFSVPEASTEKSVAGAAHADGKGPTAADGPTVDRAKETERTATAQR